MKQDFVSWQFKVWWMQRLRHACREQTSPRPILLENFKARQLAICLSFTDRHLPKTCLVGTVLPPLPTYWY
jgi:hypothetical protein